MTFTSLTKWLKAKINRKYQKQQEFTTKPAKTKKYLQKKQGGVKAEPALQLNLVSGNYH